MAVEAAEEVRTPRRRADPRGCPPAPGRRRRGRRGRGSSGLRRRGCRPSALRQPARVTSWPPSGKAAISRGSSRPSPPPAGARRSAERSGLLVVEHGVGREMEDRIAAQAGRAQPASLASSSTQDLAAEPRRHVLAAFRRGRAAAAAGPAGRPARSEGRIGEDQRARPAGRPGRPPRQAGGGRHGELETFEASSRPAESSSSGQGRRKRPPSGIRIRRWMAGGNAGVERIENQGAQRAQLPLLAPAFEVAEQQGDARSRSGRGRAAAAPGFPGGSRRKRPSRRAAWPKRSSLVVEVEGEQRFVASRGPRRPPRGWPAAAGSRGLRAARGPGRLRAAGKPARVRRASPLASSSPASQPCSSRQTPKSWARRSGRGSAERTFSTWASRPSAAAKRLRRGRSANSARR